MPVKYFTPKTSKNLVSFLYKKSRRYLCCFCNIKDKYRPKHRCSEWVEYTIFCDVFFDKELKMYRKWRFSSVVWLPKQTSQKHWFLQGFDKTSCKKNKEFSNNFLHFSARAPRFNNQSYLAPFLPPLIRTQEGLTSRKIAKLNLKSTFCLLEPLQRSSNSKSWARLSGPKFCKLQCFMNVPCILPAK